MTTKRAPNSAAAPRNITKRIQELGDWRGETLAWVRELIHDADPEIQEEWKWAKPSSPGTPVWSHDGGVCTGESYKQVVKLTFFKESIRSAAAANSAARARRASPKK